MKVSLTEAIDCNAVCCHVEARNTVYIGREDGRIAILLPNGDLLPIEHKHGGAVTCIICAGDRLVLTGSADRTIKVWNQKPRRGDLECIQTLSAHGGTITGLSFGGGLNNERLVSCSTDRTIRIWKIATERNLLLHSWFECVQTIKGSVWYSSVAVGIAQSQGDIPPVFVGDSKGIVSLMWPNLNYKSDNKLQVHDLGIHQLYFLAAQNLLVSLSYDNSARVIDLVNCSPILTAQNKRGVKYTSVAWDDLNHELYLGDQNGYLEVWNIFTDKCLAVESLSTGSISSCSISNSTPDNTQVLVTTFNQIQRWDLIRNLKFTEFLGHQDSIVALCCSEMESFEAKVGEHEKGYFLFSCSLDNTIRSWDWYDLNCNFKLEESHSEISSMVELPESTMIVTGNQDGSVRWWNYETGTTVSLKEHTNTISCMAVARTRNATFLLTGGYDGQVGIWDVTKQGTFKPRLEAMLKTYSNISHSEKNLPLIDQESSDNELLCICFNPSNVGDRPDTFLTGGNDTIIKVWDLNTHEKLGELRGHSDAVTCLVVDANFVISGSDDTTVRVWNLCVVHDGYQVSILRGHTSSIRDLIILPSCHQGNLVTCSADKTIKVWDYTLDNDFLLNDYSNPEADFTSMVYCSARKDIIVGTSHGALLTYPLQ